MPERALIRFALICLPVSLAAAVWTGSAIAHPGVGHDAEAVWSHWQWDPLVVAPLVLSACCYGIGVGRLWSVAGIGGGIRVWQAACFASGWLSLALALISPLDGLGEVLFSFHMIQHQVMMLVSAPLLVAGAPLVAFLWSLPPERRRPASRLGRLRWWRPVWRMLQRPLVAWSLYAIILWGWHVPILFEWALASYWAHALQHASFLGVALLFWWVALDPHDRAAQAVAVVGVFTTAVHSSILGAVMTFASAPWYRAYREGEPALGLSALEDQQLAGLIMWVPGGTVHLLAGIALMAMVIRDAERRARRGEDGRWAAPLKPAGLER